ncbi:MAG TPA: aminoglycoside phosphotransferase family protein [Gemmatimonadales bacterium]|nr:aminoglycoside phosphotransferase family protein [Gemmatimonadales bacterium]
MIASDARMPLLSRALDPAEVEGVLRRLAGWEGAVVRAIRAVRYKPGRRCLIEYDVALPSSAPVTLIAKARARGADRATFDLLLELRRHGFDEHSADGISVPEPIAVIPELGLWLQRKIAGVSATQDLATANGVGLARRLAEAAHKLHATEVLARREHTMADELRILHERLDALAAQRPDWAPRLERLLAACARIAATTPLPQRRGIHRDFYPDQVLVAGERLYLLDFDLYSHGDPALDIGNCIGHITEQAVRTCGDPRALADREAALEDRFVALAGEQTRPAVWAYALLTLARHVSLSAQRVDRQPFTARLLELCEERLAC